MTIIYNEECETRYYVYGLIDPFTEMPFYIGKGTKNRVYEHFREKSSSFKCDMIKGIRNRGKEPTIYYYAKGLTSDEAYNFEKILIKLYGRIRLDENGILTNRCEDNRPPRLTKKYIDELLGEDWKKEIGRKRSERQLGVPKKYDCKKNFGIYATGEAKGASNPFYGKQHTEETKLKMRAAKVGAVGNRLKYYNVIFADGRSVVLSSHAIEEINNKAQLRVKWRRYAKMGVKVLTKRHKGSDNALLGATITENKNDRV